MRKLMFIMTLVLGFGLAAIGFFLSAPIGPTASPVYSNPRLPFAPLVFILGVMFIYVSAVVYELFPGGEK